MDKLKSTRKLERSRFSRLEKECNKMLGVQPPDVPDLDQLSIKMQLLLPVSEKLEELNQQIIDLLIDANTPEKDLEAETVQVDDYREKFTTVKFQIEKLINKAATPPVDPTSSESGSVLDYDGSRRRKMKLPEIKLPKFNGDLKDWLGFWSQFEKIHLDDNIHAADKFQYLIQAMENNSEPKELVLSYPTTADNYPKVVEDLKKQYGDSDLLLQVYVRELLQLVILNVSSQKKLPLQTLYIKLESHLRALNSLNLKEADPATWLFPFVESSLSVEDLTAWQRSPLSKKDGRKENPPQTRLDYLLEFLSSEVQIKQKINLAQTGFQFYDKTTTPTTSKSRNDEKTPTLQAFYNRDAKPICIFCGRTHESKECFTAQTMDLDELKKIISAKHRCNKCIGSHSSEQKCTPKVKCMLCGNPHVPLLCPKRIEYAAGTGKKNEPYSDIANNCSNQATSIVQLQTLMVQLKGPKKSKIVRAFLDSGSGKTTILSTTAEELGLQSERQHTCRHALYGGHITEPITHNTYLVKVAQPNKRSFVSFEVRDEVEICKTLPRITTSSTLFKELKVNKIWVSDVGEDLPAIELLIGSDYLGSIKTGKVIQLKCGLTAEETKLGWTLSGLPQYDMAQNATTMAINMCTRDVSSLWDLDAIGIRDPVEIKSTLEIEQEAKTKLLQSLQRNKEGRYVVALPWKEGHPYIPTNKELAIKRLESITKKLQKNGHFQQYGQIFEDWEQEGLIERVHCTDDSDGGVIHYLPHHPVIKEQSSTTPVRPVFDASAHLGKSPSLNECLEKGPSYVKMIPDILLRFREKKVAAISDIRKAFQMIEVRKEDRDALRFLWWKNTKDGLQRQEFRHCRVPFGATSSPFILGAVLEYHLTHVSKEEEPVATKLLQSLFVDNCVASFDSTEEYYCFKESAIKILAEAKMDLRMWMSNRDDLSTEDQPNLVSVLGVNWNRSQDTLSVAIKSLDVPEVVTKRSLLSVAQKIFDPIGFVLPARIPLKTLLQKAWMEKIGWDEQLPDFIAKPFINWCHEFSSLSQIQVPRVTTGGSTDKSKWSLHLFTDGSKAAYASAVYLYVDNGPRSTIHLLGANARVAPLQTVTIPRMELMGCLIGSRLLRTITAAMDLQSVPVFCWSDSTTALSWIQKEEQWGTFVGNRCKEIRKLANPDSWRYVEGERNPADLPSRGCSPNQLLTMNWHTGPDWLNLKEQWPVSKYAVNDILVNAERKGRKLKQECPIVTYALNVEDTRYDRTYPQIVRIWAWILRLKNNVDKNKPKVQGPLTQSEKEAAELVVLKMIQQQSNIEESIKGMKCFKDSNGLYRIKTRLGAREDTFDFKYPVLLPRKHPLVLKLVTEMHREYGHAGTSFLLNKLREHYWVIKGRQTVKWILHRCFRCRRFTTKNAVVETGPLPFERISDAEVFETAGVDLAGPLILSSKKKVWICIFTCAVYRAVHLELVSSPNTAAFIRALQGFIRTHRRPKTIFCDNGTNFVGANNLFKKLDWQDIQKHDGIAPIQFRFSPPTGAWFGGFWERLIRTMKDILKRNIGRSTLTRSELETTLVKVEKLMNERPLTYVSDDPDSPQPLTPAMFMKNKGHCEFPEGQLDESEKMRIRWKFVRSLKEELENRFRTEYLALLGARMDQKPRHQLKVGDIVLVGSDAKKRIEWPLGKILELKEGIDKLSRVAKVKMSDGVFIRPVQRLFPMELDLEIKDKEAEMDVVRTRLGRKVQRPIRYQD